MNFSKNMSEETDNRKPEAERRLAPVSLLDRAVQMLKDRGPMKAKKLAADLELQNARSLSMQLQWAHDRCRREGGKWKAV